MEKEKIVLFIGTFFDTDSQQSDWIAFAAPQDCDREAELNRAHKEIYGAELDASDIEGVSEITEVHECAEHRQYRVELKTGEKL